MLPVLGLSLEPGPAADNLETAIRDLEGHLHGVAVADAKRTGARLAANASFA